MDSGILEQVEQLKELNGMHEFLQDEEFDRFLEIVLKCIRKPDVPASNVESLITELQAISAKFAVYLAFYKNVGTSEADARKRKDTYYTLRDSCNSLVDALKYVAKARQGGGFS